jgi:hypothetical protein
MKFALGCLALLALSTAVMADTKFSLGGGVNFNMINVEGSLGDFDPEISTNLAIAGKAEIGINEQWLFRTGLWLQEKSAEISYDKGGIDGTLKVNTSYLSVPLNAQFKLNENISVFGGYIADLRINDYCKPSGDFDNCSLGKDTQSLVHNANLGVSVFVNEKLNIDASYQHGLTDTMKDGYKIHTLQVMGFFKF